MRGVTLNGPCRWWSAQIPALGATESPLASLGGFFTLRLEMSLQQLSRSGTRLLAGWGCGRTGSQRQVRTAVVYYGMSQLHFDLAKAGSGCLCNCCYAHRGNCTKE